MSTEERVNWVYTKSEPDLWTVGFFRPDGTWEPESDHINSEAAAARVAWLNGCEPVRLLVTALQRLITEAVVAPSVDLRPTCCYCHEYDGQHDQEYWYRHELPWHTDKCPVELAEKVLWELGIPTTPEGAW